MSELRKGVPADAELIERRSGDYVGGPARRISSVRGIWYWLRWQFPILLVLIAIFFQSFTGRQSVVQSQRAGCLSFAKRFVVPVANGLRTIELSSHGSEAAALDDTLRQIDKRIDPSLASELNPVGRRIVLADAARGRGFTCWKAYPNASPVGSLSAITDGR